jgi:hypothetical protein
MESSWQIKVLLLSPGEEKNIINPMKNVCPICCFDTIYLTINTKRIAPNRHPSPSWGGREEID